MTCRRTGTLWEGRYRAAPIDSEAYCLACCRYIELNPVRAGMVRAPADYRWSSHHAHAEGASDPLVSGHALYERLGGTEALRRQSYRELFDGVPDEAFAEALRVATNGGLAPGDAAFRHRIADAIDRRVEPLPKGRPPKAAAEISQKSLL
jgi:putative transposase